MSDMTSSRMMSLVLALCVTCVVAEPDIIDLTHTFGYDNVHYPGNPPYNFTQVFQLPIGDGYIATGNYFQTAEHSGTHMDAPQHFCLGAKFVHEIPMDKLAGPGVVMDFRSQASSNSDYQVSLQDVKDWEAMYGPVPRGAFVLLNFGWNQHWPALTKVFQTSTPNDSTTFHMPGLGIEAIRYLAGTRRINGIGTDTPSADFGQTTNYEVHTNLLCDHGLVIIENVANIDALPTVGARVYIGALKLQNGSGTPVRLFAVHEIGFPNSSGETTLNCLCMSLVLILLVFNSFHT